MPSRWMRNSFIFLLILVAVIAIFVSFFRPPSNTETKDLSDVIALARSGQVESIEAQGDTLTVRLKNSSQIYKSRKESGSSIVEVLKNNGVQVGGDQGVSVKVKEPSQFGNWIGLLINFLPLKIGRASCRERV